MYCPRILSNFATDANEIQEERQYLFIISLRPPPSSTLFPYTTLFRSRGLHDDPNRLPARLPARAACRDRKSTRLNSSHRCISYAVFCLKKKKDPLTSSHLLYCSS